MTPATVQSLADYLEAVDADWRKLKGYTGRAVHRRDYWVNMAARILSDSAKSLSRPKSKCTTTNS